MTTKSKFFRVATEGATTDGRKIDRKAIEQIARNFNRTTYGARIWLEHKRSLLPDSPFRAYGDVLAVKAEEVDTDSGKKLALFAQVSPTPSLIAMNKERQKIYTSIELNPDFADTSQAYMVGLGVTDSPASLGTDILTFAATSGVNLFSARKQHVNNLFSEAIEATLEFEEDDQPEVTENKFSTTVKNILKRFSHKETSDDARFNDVKEALEAVAHHASETAASFATQSAAADKKISELEAALAASTSAFTAFKGQMDTQDGNPSHRPPATGGSGTEQTDF
ncbi:GPO family capsid scaffolding protein [Glaciimonas immobilis]|uniref:Phage capsid protein n=1 Tax=Glaciimonas immobilis TaxID=728004 RepID=A0A840RM19_9BURK|nr:GPO family capsid scaffolding protein [Glaciimonas immobilis]KAF3999236.1 GPO family capsid scaffolding protein [Glaciimonas immobilis]MBB5198695.1 hypothetical protein [Glaciimonas immobilis]